MRTVKFEQSAFDDISFWANNDLKQLKKIIQLIENIQKTPFDGMGKPEALKHDLKGYWSRRIDNEHRLVYKITDTDIIITACRFHYY